MNPPWLSIVGIGEDGTTGLSAAARDAISSARLVVGGTRHLALAESVITGEKWPWASPMRETLPSLLAARPEPVAVLASGDPFCFGVGPMLAATVAAGEWRCLPAPSCLSLACARLGWALQEVATISFCGRPLAPLAALLQPGARVLALSADDTTPRAVAAFLTERGFGPSEIILLETLGGPRERVRTTTAASFDLGDTHRLNLLAITLHAGPEARIIPLATGIDDDAFAHDGQITKREIRAATLSALAPRRGGLLWDIGTGSGSIAIEWMLCHPANHAIALDRRADRLAHAAANAERFGVPGLHCIEGAAPASLKGLQAPDAVFIGGGAQGAGVIDTGWAALKPGGRMVINAVTIETEAVLIAAHARLGGTLSRIGVERLSPVGRMHGYRPAMTVTQWMAVKP